MDRSILMFIFVLNFYLIAGANELPIPIPLPEPQEPVFLNPTIYYKPIVSVMPLKCEELERVEMKSVENKVLTRLCPKDFQNCLMQGACYVYDESGRFRSFNYVKRGDDGKVRFGEVNTNRCPFGYGAKAICLDPYYSVAADLQYHSLGDVIFVPRLVGAVMPDGLTHDGFLVVRDKGGSIKGPHRFDFFTGFTEPYVDENTFRNLGFSEVTHSFPYRRATLEEATRVRERTGYPGIKNRILIPPRVD